MLIIKFGITVGKVHCCNVVEFRTKTSNLKIFKNRGDVNLNIDDVLIDHILEFDREHRIGPPKMTTYSFFNTTNVVQ